MTTWQVFPRGNQPLEIETFQDFPGNGIEFPPIAISTRLNSTLLLLKTTQIRRASVLG